ncbi:unnamed protein product [Prunus armeniaca]
MDQAVDQMIDTSSRAHPNSSQKLAARPSRTQRYIHVHSKKRFRVPKGTSQEEQNGALQLQGMVELSYMK